MPTLWWRVCLGIIRPYSLVDYLFFLSLLPVPVAQRLGLVCLWIGFLFWCEAIHRDRHHPIHGWVVIICWVPGIFLVPPILAMSYLALSILYSFKVWGRLGILAPFVRGGQNFLVSAWYLGTAHLVSQLAFRLMVCRNLIGDFRDLPKDRARGLMTIPTSLDTQKTWPAWPAWTHLGAVMGTTTIWWSLGDLSPIWLLGGLTIEALSYHWTPR